MLRFAVWTLRQRRYAGLAVLMVVVAVVCVAAGTWQISRFKQNVHDNHALRSNAHAATTPLTTSMVPLTGQGKAPGGTSIRFRTVSVTGRYLAGRQQYLTEQTLHDKSGYDVVTPLRTVDGVLLVIRGFVAATSSGFLPHGIPAPPTGLVRVVARLHNADTGNDDAATLPRGEITNLNPGEQAARLGRPVYQAYVGVDSKQASTAGLAVLPQPDLSNPAGGVVAPQHFAYIIQWYLFALLALAAPFVIARKEIREAREQWLGEGLDDEQFDDQFDLPGDAAPAALPAGAGSAVAVRDGGAVQRRDVVPAEQWQRAVKLADRYGRSLGVGDEAALRRRRLRRRPLIGRSAPVVDSSREVHRAEDEYHAAYNDYLWELALSDGDVPDVAPDTGEGRTGPRRGNQGGPRTIDYEDD